MALGSSVNVHWDGLDEFVQKMLESDGTVRKATMGELVPLADFAKFLCKEELDDVRYTGALESSFVTEPEPHKLRVLVYPTAEHAMYVRMGTRPHWAPIGPLKLWAAAKLGDEQLGYAVQRSIAREGTSVYQLRKRGTKANPWPERVAARGDMQQAAKAAADRIGHGIKVEFER